MKIRLDKEKLIGDGAKTHYGVRFSLTIADSEDPEAYLRSDGWRVSEGKIFPPAMKVGRGWVPLGEAGQTVMTKLPEAFDALGWPERFNQVKFPKVES